MKMRNAGVAEVAEAIVEVEKIRLREPKELPEGEPKRLSVVRGKVNPNFYEDDTLTPEGKKRLKRLLEESLGRIQKKRETLKAKGRRIRQSEEKLKKRKEQFTLKVKAFGERYKNLKMQPLYL